MQIDFPDTGAGVSRREFMSQLGLVASLAAGYPLSALASRRDTAALPDWTGEEPWRTLASVQEHLFPATDDSPGAGDIRAVVYLRNTLETPLADAEDRALIVNGVKWLNDRVQTEKQTVFVSLGEVDREAMLRKIEQSHTGRRWLSKLLTYLIEALLADPVYGGNPGGAGWKWLQHQPGFPRPPVDKTWYRLAAPVHFNRKADG